jgi:hypothetical protein
MSHQSRGEIHEAHARLATETLITVYQAAQLFDQRCSARSLECFILRGKGGVHLDGIKVNETWHTSKEAVERFRAAQEKNPRVTA